ncbi:calmodulin-lysine N-methyltransferase [Teleopsis dalmanni]|uniref:calmodulin-lysine N-methyltransferase n=1 Tax=Teleopsis dalmanni TaxID=139649 RepID=UPI0018CEA450|nr:calmodulin-lysine N-methyltransferase [Teleopsis dalmanni]
MSTIVQNSKTSSGTVPSTVAVIQQLSSISLMLEYDIDNTLNSIKESGVNLLKMSDEKDAEVPSSSSPETNTDDIKPELPPTPPATPTLESNARKRWKLLAKVLLKDGDETVTTSTDDLDEQSASVRRFKTFDLLRQGSFEDEVALKCLSNPENWYKYRVALGDSTQQEYFVNIYQAPRQWSASDLMGFNNTGNICVWPSEEALTVYVLSQLESYEGKYILELGGGFTCLTGLMLSKYAKPYAVHLTDGNEFSVQNVKKTLCLNELSCYTKCSVLKWEDKEVRSPIEEGKFDIILSADCLFFDETRAALVDTIWYYLSNEGTALIMAPRRGKTLTQFIDECYVKGFQAVLFQRYNEDIWRKHIALRNSDFYDEDLHYPVLLHISKKPSYLH